MAIPRRNRKRSQGCEKAGAGPSDRFDSSERLGRRCRRRSARVAEGSLCASGDARVLRRRQVALGAASRSEVLRSARPGTPRRRGAESNGFERTRLRWSESTRDPGTRSCHGRIPDRSRPQRIGVGGAVRLRDRARGCRGRRRDLSGCSERSTIAGTRNRGRVAPGRSRTARPAALMAVSSTANCGRTISHPSKRCAVPSSRSIEIPDASPNSPRRDAAVSRKLPAMPGLSGVRPP